MALSILSLSPLLGPLSPGLFGIISVPRSLSSPSPHPNPNPSSLSLRSSLRCSIPFPQPFLPLTHACSGLFFNPLVDLILVPLTFL